MHELIKAVDRTARIVVYYRISKACSLEMQGDYIICLGLVTDILVRQQFFSGYGNINLLDQLRIYESSLYMHSVGIPAHVLYLYRFPRVVIYYYKEILEIFVYKDIF